MDFSYDNCSHGLCGSHLLRELTFVAETHGYAWARNMKRLLQQTGARVDKRPSKQLSERGSPGSDPAILQDCKIRVTWQCCQL
jgi:hypothetical protein